jgi:predicted ArsR family transcriptional regulator
MSEFLNNENDGGTQILECHSPILNLLEEYPIIARFEQELFETVLGTRVRREVARNSGLYECAFYFSA